MKSFFQRWEHLGFIGPAVAVMAALTAYPLVYAIRMASMRQNLTRPWVPRKFLGMGNFLDFLQDDYLGQALWITAKFALSTVFLQLVLGLLIALLLHRNLRGSTVFRVLFLTPMMVVPVVAGLIWRLMFNDHFGVVNWLLSRIGIPPQVWLGSEWALGAVVVAETWQWLPFSIIIFTVALNAIPVAYYETAEVDGASPWFRFRHITLPCLKWAAFIVVIFKLSDAIKAFDVIYVMTGGGPGILTQTLALYIHRIGFVDFEMGYASALSLLILALSLGIVFPVIWRLQSDGLHASNP